MITLFFELLLNDMIERARITVSISPIMCIIYATNSSFLATFFILLLIKQHVCIEFSCPKIIDPHMRIFFYITKNE